jgi:hypothetical protein
MGKSGNGLHLNRVALLERVVQNSWSINDLPPQIFVVCVTHEQRFRCESIWLDFNVCSSDFVHEARLADIGETSDDQCARVGIDGWQTRQMLAHLLKVCQCAALPSGNCAHATEGCTLKLLAAIEGVTKLDEAAVVLRDTTIQMMVEEWKVQYEQVKEAESH